MTDFDLNQVRRLDGGLLLVFRELLRRRRASEVAEFLGLSQSAVSHALNRLRDLFGDPLFVRRPHGFEPTQRALALGPRIEALIELAGATLGPEGRFLPAESERQFSLAAPEFVAALIGAPLIETLKARAPKVWFDIRYREPQMALAALRRGEIDLALGRYSGALPPGLEAEPLFEDSYCVAARRDHPLIRGEIDWDTWLSVGHIFAFARGETGGDDSSGIDARMKSLAAVPGWLAALTLVASTDGVCTCPTRMAERHKDMLGLQVLRPDFLNYEIKVAAVRRAGHVDEGRDWFLEQVRAAAGV